MSARRLTVLTFLASVAVAAACSVNPQPLPPTDPVDDDQDEPVGDPTGGFNADGKTSDAGASPTAEGADGGDGGDGGEADASDSG